MLKNFLLSLLFALTFLGCSVFSGYENDMILYQDNVYNKNCDIKSLKKTKNDLFFLNQAGSLARFCKEYSLSNELFDRSEEKYKSVDLKGYFSSLAQNSASLLTNENVKSYDGSFYERIMINIYKALNFLTLGDFANARVEFNRALQRQIIAKEYFAKEIEKAKQSLGRELQESNINQRELRQALGNYDKTFADFALYPDFVNPFATYLSAIFFYSQKSYSKAADLFKENLRMDGSNQQIKEDYLMANQAASSSGKAKPYIWLIYEAGRSLSLEEEQHSLPILLGNEYYNVAFALPRLSKASPSFASLFINGKKSEKVSDMDNIIATEFKITYPLKFTRALLNATSKVMLQASAAQVNDLLYVISHIYTMATTKADTRYLSSLPSSFQSAKVENKGQTITLSDDFGNTLGTFTFPNGQNGIIYVKSLNRKSIFIDQITL